MGISSGYRRVCTTFLIKAEAFRQPEAELLRAGGRGDTAESDFASIGAERVTLLAATFAECPQGELCLLEGSSGYLEVVTNQASAAKRLGCGVGAPVELTIY